MTHIEQLNAARKSDYLAIDEGKLCRGIGGCIERIRKTKGVLMTQLARTSKINRRSILRIEHTDNASPSLYTLERLCAAMGVKLSDLILEYEK